MAQPQTLQRLPDPFFPSTEHLLSTTPPSSPPAAYVRSDASERMKIHPLENSSSTPSESRFDSLPKLVFNPATQVRGRVVIFNTLTNTFTVHMLGPTLTLRSIVLRSPQHRIHCMPIRAFVKKVDLSMAGVRVGEGLVDGLVRVLPRSVVAMRVLGWYRTLYVVRYVEKVEDVRTLDI